MSDTEDKKVTADKAATDKDEGDKSGDEDTKAKKGKKAGGKKKAAAKKDDAASGDDKDTDKKDDDKDGDDKDKAAPKAKAKAKAKGKKKASSKKKGSKKGSKKASDKGDDAAAAGGDDKKEEKKAKKPRAKRSSSPAKATAASERPTRVKKEVKQFQLATASSSKAAPEVLQGKGAQLGDIENVKTALEKIKATDKVTQKLYSIVFPGAARSKAHTKKYLREFSGFAGDDVKAIKEEAVEKLAKTEQKILKQMAAVLDIETSGTKAELAEAIGNFLEKPKSSGRAYKPVGRASASTKKGKGTKRSRDGPKKVSGYILFTSSIRERIKKENKNAAPKEIISLLAAEWNELSDSDKEKWKKKADKAAPVTKKKGSTKSKKGSTKKKAAKKSKADESDDAVDESEDGDEEEGEGDEEEEEEEEEKAPKKAKKGSKKASSKKKGSGKGSKKGSGKGKKGKGKKDDSSSNEESKSDKDVEKKLEAAITKILAGADLTTTTLATVKKSLVNDEKIDDATIKAYKDFIKHTVDTKISQ